MRCDGLLVQSPKMPRHLPESCRSPGGRGSFNLALALSDELVSFGRSPCSWYFSLRLRREAKPRNCLFLCFAINGAEIGFRRSSPISTCIVAASMQSGSPAPCRCDGQLVPICSDVEVCRTCRCV